MIQIDEKTALVLRRLIAMDGIGFDEVCQETGADPGAVWLAIGGDASPTFPSADKDRELMLLAQYRATIQAQLDAVAPGEIVPARLLVF